MVPKSYGKVSRELSIDDARSTGERLLSAELPRRWSHVCGVARRARIIGIPLNGEERRILEVAAWIHDVGYAQPLRLTGLHHLDGARYLSGIGENLHRVACLVAHHSAGLTEAVEMGLGDALSEFSDERTLTRDLLWYCDMTTSLDGSFIDFHERMADVRNRYSSDHYVTRALERGMPQRISAMERAERWISTNGLADQVKYGSDLPDSP